MSKLSQSVKSLIIFSWHVLWPGFDCRKRKGCGMKAVNHWSTGNIHEHAGKWFAQCACALSLGSPLLNLQRCQLFWPGGPGRGNPSLILPSSPVPLHLLSTALARGLALLLIFQTLSTCGFTDQRYACCKSLFPATAWQLMKIFATKLYPECCERKV